jgi:hypothetical protein
MNMKTLFPLIVTLFSVSVSSSLYGHGIIPQFVPTDENRLIVFPDTKRYKTLVLDPHTHSTFSDGHVWPTVRISEALRDGLDAIAITEHLEWQPHLADIGHPDRNRAFEIADDANSKNNLIVIPGAEITRTAPASHINAIFISDANKLLKNLVPADPSDTRAYFAATSEWPAQKAVDAANNQGAFLFWNHAWWRNDFPNGIPLAPKFHIDNAKKKLLHGIEIANGRSYSEEAFQIALDLDLTLIGVSDVHGLIDWDYKPHEGGHRPVTLVLAKERSPQAIKEALFKGRTVVWFKNLLIAHKKNMDSLLEASMAVVSATYTGKSDILEITIENHSDANFLLENRSDFTFAGNSDVIELKQHATARLGIKTGTRLKRIKLHFKVLNALVKPGENAEITFASKIEVVEQLPGN